MNLKANLLFSNRLCKSGAHQLLMTQAGLRGQRPVLCMSLACEANVHYPFTTHHHRLVINSSPGPPFFLNDSRSKPRFHPSPSAQLWPNGLDVGFALSRIRILVFHFVSWCHFELGKKFSPKSCRSGIQMQH